MSEKTHALLNLNPGPPQVRRKVNLWFCCKCLFWIGCFLSGTLVVALAVTFISFSYLFIFHPHRALYLNPALLSCQPGCVVRPLIDAHQTFDIAVTVWVRATEEEEKLFQSNNPWEARLLFGRGFSEERNFDDENMLGSEFWWSAVTTELIESEVILETPLYSDFAFRGLRLSDKGISTVINFRLPTARFLGVDLSSSDLRASFVLVPSSPSPMDHLKKFSGWLPHYIELLPRRARPFPLGSPDQGSRTLEDEALESFSISIPLIKFQEIQSHCPMSTRKEHTNYHKIEGPADHDFSKKEPDANKSDMPAYKRHPHVITRTHLRVVDETKLFDRRVYDEQHEAIKATFCGGDVGFRRRCSRDYLRNGHWETRLQLEVPIAANETETEIHWAYAPYLSTLKHGAGPLDLIAVPVMRENCSANTDETVASSRSVGSFPKPADDEFMDISWRISYSGRSPGMQQFADIFSFPLHINYNASPSTKFATQDGAELMNGIFGHKFHDDAHPRRRILLFLFNEACWCILLFLDFHYWYTRSSTVSITIPGTAFLVIRFVLGAVIGIASFPGSQPSIMQMLKLFLRVPSTMIGVIPMIVTISRVEFRWKGAMRISIVRRVATHKERASMRLDNRTNWLAKTGLLLSLVGINYFFAPENRFVIPPAMPLDVRDNNQLMDVIIQSLGLAGNILQLSLNHQSRSFAGQYKSAVALKLMLQVTFFATFVPALLGRIDTQEGVTVQRVGLLVMLAVTGWQALTLPSVSQTEFDEDDE